MDTQNITLALPKDILHRVKLIAAQRETSVSKLLTQALVGIVQQEDEYTQAQRRHLQALERGFDLGTKGRLRIKRDDLHERR